MSRFIYLSIATVMVVISILAWAQRDFSDVEIKTIHAAGNIYMLEGRGGNIGVSVGSDGILMVDDQFEPLADKIEAALKKLSDGQLKFVLNTHFHGDHTGGNEVFGPTAPIIAHTNVRERLKVKLSPEGLPIITFDTSLSIHFNGEEIRVIHFPKGHTDGDSVIFFTGANVVHMGDHFFSGRFPFIDLNDGGDVEGFMKNVEGVIHQLPADVKIIPGHGPLSTLDDLKAFHQMLVETVEIVRQRMADGENLDEIKAEGLPDKWQSWGTGFISTDRWIEIIYQSLSRKEGNK